MTATLGINPDDVPTLVELLFQGRKATQYAVADILGRMGNRAAGAVPSIERCLLLPETKTDYSLAWRLREALTRIKAVPPVPDAKAVYQCRRSWDQFVDAVKSGNVSRGLDALSRRVRSTYQYNLENGSLKNDRTRLDSPLGPAEVSTYDSRRILFPRTMSLNGMTVSIGVACEEDYSGEWKISAF
jgi:hypothetical protein